MAVAKPLDRETKDTYIITLMARDNGSPSRQNKTYLHVTIDDVNDNAPVIEPKTLKGSILENKGKNTEVVQVVATDRDIGKNGEFVFGMKQNDLFQIDAITGIVRAVRSLDREEQDRYVLTITVTDQGDPKFSTEAQLNVTVLDVDDNCPKFVHTVYTATITENAKYGDFVVTVTATDRDIGPNAALSYGVLESSGAFTVDQDSGNVTVIGKVDLEYRKEYHLKIRAGSLDCGTTLNDSNVGEGGKPIKRNYTFTDVYITATDINDNAPVFQNGNQKIIFDDFSKTELIKLNATDVDGGKGGEVSLPRCAAQHFPTIPVKEPPVPPVKEIRTNLLLSKSGKYFLE